MTLEMSADYQKGRYDELVQRHKEMIELYKHLLWQMQTSQLTNGSGVHGAEVNVYAGSKIDPRAVTWSIGIASIAFTVLAFFIGFAPLTFGVPISLFSILFGLSVHLSKKKNDRENQSIPRLPKIP